MENASQFAAEYNKAVDEVSRATNWLSRWCNAGGALIASGFKKNYEEANEPKMARVSTEILEEIVDGLRKGGVIMGKDQKTGARVPLPPLSEVNIAKLLESPYGVELLNKVNLKVFRESETVYLKALRTRDAKIKELELEYYKSNPAPPDYNPTPKVEASTDPLAEIARREKELSKWPAKKGKKP